MPDYRCAVVIPTKNALPRIGEVISKVKTQKTNWEFQIIVIDSGSKDGTVEYLRTCNEVHLIEIRSEDFGHGRTRNLGVEAANADFVAFLTHDAEPYDENWLASLVAAAEQDHRIAGVFGKHIAYPGASPFTKRDLDLHFKGFLNHPLVVSKDLHIDRYEVDIGRRQFLHFYSDNNSLLRKSVWKEIPYPDVEFAEDQIWAQTVIEAGFSKAYAPEAVVYHSHDYSPIQRLKRSFDESRNFKKYFDYNLSGSLLRTFGRIVASILKAYIQKIEKTYGPVRVSDRHERALDRAFLVLGHYLGAKHEFLPLWLQKKLSLDNDLFRR